MPRSTGRSGPLVSPMDRPGEVSFVPSWDGRADSFGHFIVECKWSLQSSKSNERPLLAARIVRRALQSSHSALVQLMYKLRPEDFKTEADVAKLIKFLEESPLNKQPLPDAGAKIGGYYRRLQRKPMESVNAFLIREDKLHDDMLRALQRLLREKELDFDEYDMNIDELRRFCGFEPGQSLYYGEQDFPDTDAEAETDGEMQANEETRTQTPRGSQAGKPFTPSRRSSKSTRTTESSSSSKADESKRGKDLLERMMEKGLMPLAALDVIRGWLVLEMAVSSEEDRRLIKAATRNRLAYSEIKTALLGLFEEKIARNQMTHRPHHMHRAYYNENEYGNFPEVEDENYAHFQEDYPQGGHDYEDYYQQEQCYEVQNEEQAEVDEYEDAEVDAELMRLQEEQEEIEKNRRELEALLGETDRNLVEARKAVAAAHKDRGWSGTVQQRQPRSTSTFPWKGKGKGKPMSRSPPPATSKSNGFDNHWMKGGGKFQQQRNRFHNGKNFGKSKGKGSYGSNYHMGMMEVQDESMFPMVMAANPESSNSPNEARLPPEQSLVDTGATATAGGKQAVKDLCKALVSARPNLDVTVFEAARPWFRFGNGRWGRALYKITLNDKINHVSISLYALPAVGVPVLTGMKELRGLQAILNCETGACVLNGKPVFLKKNHKEHLIIDYLEHIFPKDDFSLSSQRSKSPSTTSSKTTPRVHFAADVEVEECHVIDIFTLDFDFQDLYVSETEAVDRCDSFCASIDFAASVVFARHLGVTETNLQHLFTRAVAPNPKPRLLREHGQQPQGGDPKDSARGSSERAQRGSQDCQGGSKGHVGRQGPEGLKEQDRTGLHSKGRSGFERSPIEADAMAVFQRPPGQELRQPIRVMDRMSTVRSTHQLCASSERTRSNHTPRSSPECHLGAGETSSRWLGDSRHHRHSGEGHDHGDCQGVSVDKAKGEEGLQAERLGQGRLHQEGQVNAVSEHKGELGDDRGHRGLGVRAGGACERQEEGQGQVQQGRVIQSADETTPLSEATRQRLLKCTTEFNVCSYLGTLQDSVKPFLVWEVCCRADSELIKACEKEKLQGKRKTLTTGYDIGKPADVKRLVEEAKEETPERSWFSLVCTAITSIQNLNQRDWKQVEDLRKKRQRCRKQLRGAIAVIWAIILASGNKSKFYFEWPKHAIAGWKLPELQHFIKQYEQEFGRLYFTQIDGCQHGMRSPEGFLIQKSWLVMSNDPEFDSRCGVKCDRSHEHRPGGMVGMGSQAVAETAFYPKSMVEGIARLWKSQWMKSRHSSPREVYKSIMAISNDSVTQSRGEKELDNVSKQDRERTLVMLHRLHRAAGHPSNRSLARLCQDRGLPPWVSQLALQLRCQACVETKKGAQMTLPASIESRPRPWQMLGLDVFELYFPKQKLKARYLLTVCLTMRFVSVHLLWQGDVAQTGTDSGEKLINAFVESWLLHRPRPEWLLVDAQTPLSKGDFAKFCQSIGVGLSVVPGEAHWQHGATESMVKAVKETMKRIRNEQSTLSPKLCGLLASVAQNQVDRVKGFSPVQWAYGLEPGQWHLEHDPLEVNSHNNMSTADFWQVQKNRDKVETIHKQELAAARMTRLYNASGRPTSSYQVGDWACVWRNTTLRARRNEFQNEPRFIGPGRVAMIEPAVLPEGHAAVYWILMGTSLWRCSPEQVRPASEVEILAEMAKQGERITTPMSEMLKQLHSSVDVTKEPRFDPEDLLPEQPRPEGEPDPDGEDIAIPPERWQSGETLTRARSRSRERPEERRRRVQDQVELWDQLQSINNARRLEGLPPLTRLPENLPTTKPDFWEYSEVDGKLIRHHCNQQWNLFKPTTTTGCPVDEKFIQPQRRTIWWDEFLNGTYEDNWKKAPKQEQTFARPWTGRTEFQVRAGGRKRKPEPEQFDMEDDQDDELLVDCHQQVNSLEAMYGDLNFDKANERVAQGMDLNEVEEKRKAFIEEVETEEQEELHFFKLHAVQRGDRCRRSLFH